MQPQCPRRFAALGYLLILSLSLMAQDRPAGGPEADTSTLIPSAIKEYEVILEVGDTRLPVRLQYAVQGETIFVLPVWVAGAIERVIDDQSTPLRPQDRIVAVEDSRTVRLTVAVRNLVDSPELEKTIVEKLRQRVIDQQALDEKTRFKIERPNINPGGIRFTLIGAGRGDYLSPAEIAVADPVARPVDGILSFTIDTGAVRKIESDRSLKGGLTAAALTILPTGPMKVRFERLEVDAQLLYLRATLDDFRKRVGSLVDPTTGKSPDVLIPVGTRGTAEARNRLRSMLTQTLQVTVSTRQGVAEPPLLPFLEKAVDSMLNASQVDASNDQQRVTFLMDNQVTISSTLGEIKRLGKLDEQERSAVFRAASDNFEASRQTQNANYGGSVKYDKPTMVSIGLFGNPAISANYDGSKTQSGEKHNKSEVANQQQAFDRLLQEFDGKTPTLSGIRFDDSTIASSTKQAETRFQQSSFFIDYTMHRFSPIALTGSIDTTKSLAELLKQNAVLTSEFRAVSDLVGTPEKLASAKANLDRVNALADQLQAKIQSFDATMASQSQAWKKTLEDMEKTNLQNAERYAAELQKKWAALDQAIAAFETRAKERLAIVDGSALGKLSAQSDQLSQQILNLKKRLARLKQITLPVDLAADADAFIGLEKDVQPPWLDCTGPIGVDAKTAQAAQAAWAYYLHENAVEKDFPLTKDGKFKITMCLIPPGKYFRGEGDAATAVTLTQPVWVGKYEITQAQYQVVMDKNPSHFAKSGDDARVYPVEKVSWVDCNTYSRTVNQDTGLRYKLLSEAQWEFAYRAGTRTAYYVGNDAEKLGEIAVFVGGAATSGPTRVGSRKPNAFGLHDMAGNVWEWVIDWHDPEFHATGTKVDPVNTAPGVNRTQFGFTNFYEYTERVNRGGSWYDAAPYCAAAYQGHDPPTAENSNLGMRLALVPTRLVADQGEAQTP